MGYFGRWALEALAARLWWRWYGPTLAWLLLGLGWLVVVALWLMVVLGLLLGFASGLHRWGEVLACALLAVVGAKLLLAWARRLRRQEDAAYEAVTAEEPIAVDARAAGAGIGFEELAEVYLRGLRHGYQAGRDDAQAGGGAPAADAVASGREGQEPPAASPPRAVVRELPRPGA
jgi:uncharacterized protein YhhL (DUF1145 family)